MGAAMKKIEGQVVEILGKPMIFNTHEETCACPRCTRPVTVFDLGDWLFVESASSVLFRELRKAIPWIDYREDFSFGGALVRAGWRDLVLDAVTRVFGDSAGNVVAEREA